METCPYWELTTNLLGHGTRLEVGLGQLTLDVVGEEPLQDLLRRRPHTRLEAHVGQFGAADFIASDPMQKLHRDDGLLEAGQVPSEK